VHSAKVVSQVSGEFPLDFLSTNFTTSLLQSTNTVVAVGIKVKMLPHRAGFFSTWNLDSIVLADCGLGLGWRSGRRQLCHLCHFTAVEIRSSLLALSDAALAKCSAWTHTEVAV